MGAPPLSSDTVTSYAVSPTYSADHTLWAVGQLNGGSSTRDCLTVACEWVYKSSDGGVTWSVEPFPTNVNPATVLLPSDYSTDPTVFVRDTDGPGDVLRSTDDGATWSGTGTYLPSIGAASQPGQPAGHHRIVVASSYVVTALQTYDEATGTVSLGPTVPPGLFIVGSPAFVDPNTFFIVAETMVENAGIFAAGLGVTPSTPPELLRCDLRTCTDQGQLPQAETEIAVSPDYATDHTLAFWGIRGAIDVTQDGGATFTSVGGLMAGAGTQNTLGPMGVTFTNDTPSGPRLLVSSQSNDAGGIVGHVTAIVMSAPSPTATVRDSTTPDEPWGLTWTPDGHIWTQAFGTQSSGPLCSADLGVTWAAHC